jgi:DNA-binding response OmpR family regulator
MGSNSTLLCIHRDPSQLSLLQEHGYELLTATNGSDGLRLFMSQPVDAIVLDYQLGLLDGGVVAAEIKKVKPQVPIVMLAEAVELPHDALKSVDALVSKSDGPHFLLASVRSVLDGKVAQRGEGNPTSQASIQFPSLPTSWDGTERRRANPAELTNDKGEPFSPKVWRSIRDGTIQF